MRRLVDRQSRTSHSSCNRIELADQQADLLLAKDDISEKINESQLAKHRTACNGSSGMAPDESDVFKIEDCVG